MVFVLTHIVAVHYAGNVTAEGSSIESPVEISLQLRRLVRGVVVDVEGQGVGSARVGIEIPGMPSLREIVSGRSPPDMDIIRAVATHT